MCLIIASTDKKKIAKEDIVCYKILHTICKDSARAYIQNFEYEIKKLYETNIEFTDSLRVFDSLAVEDRDSLIRRNIPIKSINKGFHSAKSISRITSENHFGDIYECIIPKDSEYYEDKTNLIVSNKIIILKEIKRKEYVN